MSSGSKRGTGMNANLRVVPATLHAVGEDLHTKAAIGGVLSRVASNFILDSAAEAAVSPALVEAELAKSLIEKLAGK